MLKKNSRLAGRNSNLSLSPSTVADVPIGDAKRLITMVPVQTGDFENSSVEFGDHQTVRRIHSIKRGLLYELTRLGFVKSVSLRRPGQKFSKRLWHMDSIRKYLHGLLEEQNQPKAPQSN